jgi:hypothetical protein
MFYDKLYSFYETKNDSDTGQLGDMKVSQKGDQNKNIF